MGIRLLVCTLFVVALFLNTAHASLFNGNPQEIRSHAFSKGRDGLKEWPQLRRARADHSWKYFGEEKQWRQKIADAIKDSLRESIDSDSQKASAEARILVAPTDYAGDYTPVHNDNTFNSPPNAPPARRRRRLLQDYSPVANERNSLPHKRRSVIH